MIIIVKIVIRYEGDGDDDNNYDRYNYGKDEL